MKKVYKFLLADNFAIGRNESWFSDMAKEGLHLKKLGNLFAIFEKGEPKETEYRIDYIKANVTEEQLAVYSNCGWDYVTDNRKFYVFSSPVSLNTTELHTDTIEQSLTLSDLDKFLRNNMILCSVLIFAAIAMILSIYIFQDAPILFMVQGQFVQQILMVALDIFLICNVVHNYKAIRSLRKSLEDGTPINHHEEWKGAHRIKAAFNIVIICLGIFMMIYPFVEIAKREQYTLSQNQTNLPCVNLSEIENNPNLIREKGYTDKGVDWNNSVRYKWNLMAPAIYEIDENGIVTDEMWDDNSGTYSPSIHTKYYHITFKSITNYLLKDLVHRQIYCDDIKIEEISYKNIERVVVAQQGITKYIFAILDNQVIYVRYHGNAEIQEVMPLVLERLISCKL